MRHMFLKNIGPDGADDADWKCQYCKQIGKLSEMMQADDCSAQVDQDVALIDALKGES